MSQIITSNDLLGTQSRWPADFVTLWNSKTNARVHVISWRQQLIMYPTMTWSEDWRLLDPKDHVICAIRDLFEPFEQEDTLKLDLSNICLPCVPSDTPLQRRDPKGGGNWWTFCKKCGDWLKPLDLERR